MSTLGNYIGGAIYGVKNALGLGQINLFPGDVAQKTLGVPAQTVYGGPGASVQSYQISPQVQSKIYSGNVGVNNGGLYTRTLGAPTSNPSNSGGGGSNGGAQPSNTPAGNQTQQNNVNQQVQDLGSIIENDYNTAMSALNNQESTLRGQAATAGQQVSASYAPAQTELTNAQNQNLNTLSGNEQTAQTQEASGMQQARDLFRQTQQQNIAQLSALGLSSSSVMEALAEKLGVATAQRIGSLAQSTTDVINNIGKEKARIQEYYGSKLSDLKAQEAAAQSNIQQSLLEGINQINSARNQAANDKANQRIQLISNAQTALANLQAQAQNFQQQLDIWNQQKTDALNSAAKFVANPTNFSGQNVARSNIGNIPTQGGLQLVTNPTVITPTGYVNPSNNNQVLDYTKYPHDGYSY